MVSNIKKIHVHKSIEKNKIKIHQQEESDTTVDGSLRQHQIKTFI